MEKYQKRDVPDAPPIRAIQLTKENVKEVAVWCGGREVEEIDALDPEKTYVGLNLSSWSGMVRASEGDYIIKDSLDTFHVRWPGEFEHQFKKVED